MVEVGELGQDLKALESIQCYGGHNRDLSVGGNFSMECAIPANTLLSGRDYFCNIQGSLSPSPQFPPLEQGF